MSSGNGSVIFTVNAINILLNSAYLHRIIDVKLKYTYNRLTNSDIMKVNKINNRLCTEYLVASSLGVGGGDRKGGGKESLQGHLRILNICAQKVNAKC